MEGVALGKRHNEGSWHAGDIVLLTLDAGSMGRWIPFVKHKLSHALMICAILSEDVIPQ